MSRRKPQSEAFDVVDFLRESDDDLKSALNSLLRSPAASMSDPGPNLSPPAEVSSTASSSDLSLITEAGPKLNPEIKIDEGSLPAALIPAPNLEPGPKLDPPQLRMTMEIPAPLLSPGINLNLSAASVRHFPIREMRAPEDAHSRAEQQVYEYLWHNAQTLDEHSRVITIGFGAMAKMVRLSESNARINARSLVAKLAMEESGGYNCERSVGRTYRIFDSTEILRRRRTAGLIWYTRRTLAVVFVDPATGQPIDLGIKRPKPKRPDLKKDPGLNLGSGSKAYEALSRYGPIDDEVIARLRTATARVCPDFTDDELAHFIRVKGDLIASRKGFPSSPIGFLLTSVPKCFMGAEFEAFRADNRRKEAEQQDELRRWYDEQRAILEDPKATEEDRKWAEKVLFPEQFLPKTS